MSVLRLMEHWLKIIPFRIGYYLAGFVDGEGSFNLSVRKGEGYRYGWQLGLSFNVSQRDKTNLYLLKRYLGCGRIKTRKDGLHSFVVENFTSLKERVTPFFERFNFLSSRTKTNFSIFRKIVFLIDKKEHLNPEGFKKILDLREILNEGRGRKRKYNLKDVNFAQRKSPETIRRNPETNQDMI